jgi:hypothetical protein
MNPTGNKCPYDYDAIRGLALDFAKDAETAISFSDEKDGTSRRFRVQVFVGSDILSERLYEITYTEGKDIIAVLSYHPIPEFDGYIDLSVGKLAKHFRVLHYNAGLRLEP